MSESRAEEVMTEDERSGIAWWNSLTPMARSYWLAYAGTAVVADAWEFFKRDQAQTNVT